MCEVLFCVNLDVVFVNIGMVYSLHSVCVCIIIKQLLYVV